MGYDIELVTIWHFVTMELGLLHVCGLQLEATSRTVNLG